MKPKQTAFYYDDGPQVLDEYQLYWCKTVLARKLVIERADYYRLYDGSDEATIVVRHKGLLSHPRRDDILRHAANYWYPTNEGGVVTQIDANTFHVCTWLND